MPVTSKLNSIVQTIYKLLTIIYIYKLIYNHIKLFIIMMYWLSVKLINYHKYCIKMYIPIEI